MRFNFDINELEDSTKIVLKPERTCTLIVLKRS